MRLSKEIILGQEHCFPSAADRRVEPSGRSEAQVRVISEADGKERGRRSLSADLSLQLLVCEIGLWKARSRFFRTADRASLCLSRRCACSWRRCRLSWHRCHRSWRRSVRSWHRSPRSWPRSSRSERRSSPRAVVRRLATPVARRRFTSLVSPFIRLFV